MLPQAGSIAHQPTGFRNVARRIGRRDRVARRQQGQLDAPFGEEGTWTDEKRVGPVAPKIFEGGVDLAAGAGIENPGLQPDGASSRLHVSQCVFGKAGICRIDEHSDSPCSGHHFTQKF